MTHEAGIEAGARLTHEQAMDIACGVMFNGMRDKTLGPALEEAIQAYLSASGMVLVPREPTWDMIVAGVHHENMGDMAGRYNAMLSAAPDPFESKP